MQGDTAVATIATTYQHDYDYSQAWLSSFVLRTSWHHHLDKHQPQVAAYPALTPPPELQTFVDDAVTFANTNMT